MEIKCLYEGLSSKCGCNKVFCSTCGGFAAKLSELNINEEDWVNSLLCLRSLAFKRRDFQSGKGYGYPKEPEASQYVIFISANLKNLSRANQKRIIEIWSQQAETLQDFVVDGVGYYLIPESLKYIWKPVLIERKEANSSISETLNLKY